MGAEAETVPGHYGLPLPPDEQPNQVKFGVLCMVCDLHDAPPLESFCKLSEDVEALREACVSTVTAFQETRETVTALRADFLGRLAPMELRIPAGLGSHLSYLQDYREAVQGHLESLRDVVSKLAAWTASRSQDNRRARTLEPTIDPPLPNFPHDFSRRLGPLVDSAREGGGVGASRRRTDPCSIPHR